MKNEFQNVRIGEPVDVRTIPDGVMFGLDPSQDECMIDEFFWGNG